MGMKQGQRWTFKNEHFPETFFKKGMQQISTPGETEVYGHAHCTKSDPVPVTTCETQQNVKHIYFLNLTNWFN